MAAQHQPGKYYPRNVFMKQVSIWQRY